MTAGTLSFQSIPTLGGSITVASGAVLSFDGGPTALSGATSSGPGLLQLNGAILTISGDHAMAANLLAPLVINTRTRAADQLILSGTNWPVRAMLN